MKMVATATLGWCSLLTQRASQHRCYGKRPAKPIRTTDMARVTRHVSGRSSVGRRMSDLCDLRVFTQLLPTPYLGRRNSQEKCRDAFHATRSGAPNGHARLFPTSFLRDELRLTWQKSWNEQTLPVKLKEENASKLAICQSKVVDLLRQANSVGKVILVTLARKPWVFDSCRNFFPTVGQAIRELNVPIIYAQEVAAFDYNKGHAMSTPPEVERFWSSMKAKAIARECKNFYSQYDGQSWKNVISIGDSDFERIGTMLATQDYMQQTGIQSGAAAVVDDHVYKVRTKTLKMIEQPSLDELNTQLGLLRSWLPHMIKLDSDFDLNLNTASDPTVLKRITATLLGESSEADSSPMSPDT
ncbi:Kinesin-like protein KIF15 [Durusdinium trenchii]|uniref:Kinesin-like protein KIF15 n=1 Tax=Durusdinium trenchii TaxID=1381693 RepID=A0ABP0MEN9_9DINO